MKFLLALVAVVAVAFAQQSTHAPRHHTPCQICDYIVGMAEHHKQTYKEDQAGLQKELLRECEHLRRYQGDDAVTACDTLVNNNIATIFTDIVTLHKDPFQVCSDLKQCTGPEPTRPHN